jgi:hypothetical protein
MSSISPLGLLAEQQEALEVLREAVRTSEKGDEEERQLAESDRALLRFLRARKFHVEKAKKMAFNNLEWRAKWKPLQVGPADMPNALPSGAWRYAGYGKNGMPIILIKASLWRPSLYYGVDEYVKMVSWFLEHNFQRMNTDETNIEKSMILFDLSGFSLFNNDMRCVIQLIDINQNQYPERLGLAFVFNAPWVFQGVWKIIRPLLDPVTAAKVHMLGGDYKDTLLEYIDEEVLSTDIGGSHAEYPIPTAEEEADSLYGGAPQPQPVEAGPEAADAEGGAGSK